jgi:hypothetical protein
MRRFLRRLLVSFERDDLFLRVVFVLSGVLFGGIGIALLVFVSTHAGVSLFAEVLFWAFAALFTAAGGVMAARCALPAQSRLARFPDRNLPDAVGLEESVLLIAVIYLPAAVLTLLIRFLGVRGQRGSMPDPDNDNRIGRTPARRSHRSLSARRS